MQAAVPAPTSGGTCRPQVKSRSVTEPLEQPLQLVSWSLDDGEAAHQESPDSFWMPPKEERESLRPGDIVKLMFRMILRDPGSGAEQEKVERMWVGVTGRDGRGYVRALDNDPHSRRTWRPAMRSASRPDT